MTSKVKKKNNVIKMSDYKKKKFDAIAFAKKKLLKQDTKNAKYWISDDPTI
jgi:hypothetical protein